MCSTNKITINNNNNKHNTDLRSYNSSAILSTYFIFFLFSLLARALCFRINRAPAETLIHIHFVSM